MLTDKTHVSKHYNIVSPLLQLCGTVTLGLGIWTLSQKWYYLYLVQDTVYKMMIITLVVTGTATAGLGCLGLLARSKTLLTLVINKTFKVCVF